eukprot:RCo004259
MRSGVCSSQAMLRCAHILRRFAFKEGPQSGRAAFSSGGPVRVGQPAVASSLITEPQPCKDNFEAAPSGQTVVVGSSATSGFLGHVLHTHQRPTAQAHPRSGSTFHRGKLHRRGSGPSAEMALTRHAPTVQTVQASALRSQLDSVESAVSDLTGQLSRIQSGLAEFHSRAARGRRTDDLLARLSAVEACVDNLSELLAHIRSGLSGLSKAGDGPQHESAPTSYPLTTTGLTGQGQAAPKSPQANPSAVLNLLRAVGAPPPQPQGQARSSEPLSEPCVAPPAEPRPSRTQGKLLKLWNSWDGPHESPEDAIAVNAMPRQRQPQVAAPVLPNDFNDAFAKARQRRMSMLQGAQQAQTPVTAAVPAVAPTVEPSSPLATSSTVLTPVILGEPQETATQAGADLALPPTAAGSLPQGTMGESSEGQPTSGAQSPPPQPSPSSRTSDFHEWGFWGALAEQTALGGSAAEIESEKKNPLMRVFVGSRKALPEVRKTALSEVLRRAQERRQILPSTSVGTQTTVAP